MNKTNLGYIELLIYRSIYSGPLDFDISEFYCIMLLVLFQHDCYNYNINIGLCNIIYSIYFCFNSIFILSEHIESESVRHNSNVTRYVQTLLWRPFYLTNMLCFIYSSEVLLSVRILPTKDILWQESCSREIRIRTAEAGLPTTTTGP